MTTSLQLSFIVVVAVMYSLMVMGAQWANARGAVENGKEPNRFPIYVLRLCVGGFLFFTGIVALQGSFADFNTLPPPLFIAVAIAFAGMLYLAFSAKMTTWLGALPLGIIMVLQTFRLIVEIQLHFAYEAGLIPKIMTFAGANFDIVVGLSAPIVGHFVYHAEKKGSLGKWKPIAIAWNIGGLVLLLNIVVISILSLPTPFRRIFEDPPNTLVGQFPFVWLPCFLVPFAFFLHLIALRKLGRMRV